MTRKEILGLLVSVCRDGAAMSGYDASRISRIVRTDSVDFVNLARDFETRILNPYRDKFQELRARDFIPTNTDGIQTMSATWVAQFLSQVGTAELVSDFSDDLPVISVSGRTFNGKLATFGGAGQWTAEDVLRAAMGPTNLPTETLTALRRAIDTAVDRTLALGVAKAGINGFLNHPDVSVVALDMGDWLNPSHTAADVVQDFINYVGKIRARHNFIEASRPDTVLFDPATYIGLSAKLDVSTFGKNALQLIREAAPEHGIRDIEEWSYLSTAGSGSGPRCVIYRRDPKIVSAVVPLEYYQLEPQRKGLVIQVPALARCGGTVVVEPATMAYFENSRS